MSTPEVERQMRYLFEADIRLSELKKRVRNAKHWVARRKPEYADDELTHLLNEAHKLRLHLNAWRVYVIPPNQEVDNRVFAFACSVAGTDWGEQIINARTLGRAKYQYHLSVTDAWPDVPFTAIRARKIGPPHTSPDFIRNAQYRGLPNVRCGQRVKVGAATGVIIGHNSSANFDVLFDDDSPRYAGRTLNCHPNEVIIDS